MWSPLFTSSKVRARVHRVYVRSLCSMSLIFCSFCLFFIFLQMLCMLSLTGRWRCGWAQQFYHEPHHLFPQSLPISGPSLGTVFSLAMCSSPGPRFCHSARWVWWWLAWANAIHQINQYIIPPHTTSYPPPTKKGNTCSLNVSVSFDRRVQSFFSRFLFYFKSLLLSHSLLKLSFLLPLPSLLHYLVCIFLPGLQFSSMGSGDFPISDAILMYRAGLVWMSDFSIRALSFHLDKLSLSPFFTF